MGTKNDWDLNQTTNYIYFLVKTFSLGNFEPDDKKQEAGGIRVQLGEGQLAFQAVHPLAS